MIITTNLGSQLNKTTAINFPQPNKMSGNSKDLKHDKVLQAPERLLRDCGETAERLLRDC